MARNVKFELRRGAGSSLEVLYGKVSLRPTLMHNVASSVVLPATTTFDLINGIAIATNVAPSPDPVDGMVEWAYVVKVEDNHCKTFEFMVGVPDGTTEINFNELPRYFETKPPLFGRGPQGVPGSAATIAIGTTTSGPTPAVTNTGTSTDAVLNFTLAKGDKGDTGTGVAILPDDKLVTDSRNTYPEGVSVFNVGATNGWPTGSSVVVTHRNNARITQEIRNSTGTAFWTRGASSLTWNDFKQVAYDDLATPVMNGLMPALDKAKLDGMTPTANSKTFAALPSTYPAGFSVSQVRVSDGWPLTTTGTVVTQKTITGNSAVSQWLYSVEGGSPQYRVSGDAGAWQAFESVATETSVTSRTGFVRPEDFGAVGDGVADDSEPLEQAIAHGMTNRRTVVLDAAKIYGITRTITNTVKPTNPSEAGKLCVSMRSTQEGEVATIKVLDSASSSAARVVLDFRGTELPTGPLTGSTQMQSRRWYVGTGTYFGEGMLMGIESSLPWYYDPRTESTDARKSELHRVESRDGRYVYTEAPAFDGYALTNETVTAYPLIPIKVMLKDLRVERTLPPEALASDSLRRVGVNVTYAVDSRLENVEVYGGTAGGIKLVNCYDSHILGGKSIYSNNYFEGYGVQIGGSTFCSVRNRYLQACRRGVDISQGTRFVSRHTTVKDCEVMGGGKNSRGVYYNYSPVDGSLGDAQSGMGSHGPSDFALYEGNTILDMHAGITCRGSNEIIRNNRLYGRYRLDAIAIADGGGVYIVEGNTVASGWQGTRKNSTIIDGGANINTRRAKMFLKVYPNADSANLQLTVRNNYAEVQDIFIQFGVEGIASAVPPRAVIADNTCFYASSASNDPRYFLFNPIPGELAGSLYRWAVGPNVTSNQAGTEAISLTKGINLASAKVLDYATSGATT